MRKTKVFEIPFMKAGKAWGIFHELGHNIGMPDIIYEHVTHGKQEKPDPADWDCGKGGTIMGGNSRMEWSQCSALSFRAQYTRLTARNKWCLKGKNAGFGKI